MDYVSNNSHFAVATSSNCTRPRLDEQKVIVIRRVLDKEKVAWLLVVLLVISPGLGALVGVCSHRLNVGFAVSAGIFALASFSQALAGMFQG